MTELVVAKPSSATSPMVSMLSSKTAFLIFSPLLSSTTSRLRNRRAPPVNSNQGPNRLHHPERPRTLGEAVDRCQYAGAGEGQDEPTAAMFQRVENKHGRDRQQSEQTQ